MKISYKLATALVICTIYFLNSAFSQSKTTIHLPDITGYYTLKGDFHTHTVYSDGKVWPAFRVYEALRDGLDFIALTDHIDYQGYPQELEKDYNKPLSNSCQCCKRYSAHSYKRCRNLASHSTLSLQCYLFTRCK